MNDKSANDLQMEELDVVQDIEGHTSRKKMAIDINGINSDKRRREDQSQQNSVSSNDSPLKPKNKDKDKRSSTIKSKKEDYKSKRRDEESDINSP